MSLNKTLLRLFHEIRRETKRNPGFADRIDAVLRAHGSLREVPDALVEEMAEPVVDEAELGPPASSRQKKKAGKMPALQAPALNPVGLLQREGADALQVALEKFDQAALHALVAEHNLDPSGETRAFDRDALAAHVLAQAAARVERDRKLFDY